MNIPSIYNFVPLSERVFYPNWGEPSHDIPFSDAVSGTLTVKLEAKTPIFIRGSDPKPDNGIEANLRSLFERNGRPFDSNSFPKEFLKWMRFHCNERGKCSIPETSLHGMLRNVLKIVGFGSFRDTQDRAMSVRDLSDVRYRRMITDVVEHDDRVHAASKAKGGWLRVDPEFGEWTIRPCEVVRVEQGDLECFKRHPERSLEGYWKENRRAKPGQPREKWQLRDVESKYRFWGNDLSIRFEADLPEVHTHHKKMPLYYALAHLSQCGLQRGVLVFTGQISPEKHMEFIFFTRNGEPPLPPIALAKETVSRFLDTHGEEAASWKYWKRHLRSRREIPVFWLEDDAGGVASFGLAQMFRAPAPCTIRDGIPDAHFAPGLDIADRLFGTIEGRALKGRVWCDGLEIVEDAKPLEPIVTILGSPKPSFAPSYLERPNLADEGFPDDLDSEIDGESTKGERYPSWLANKVRLRGWKRYPVPVDSGEPRHIHDPNGKFKVATAFEPLPDRTKFSGTIRFHNLRMAELGALLWALEFGGHTELRHSIGMGKSLGLGSVCVRVTAAKLKWQGRDTQESAELFPDTSADHFFLARKKAVEDFEAQMAPYWANSEAMTEFIALATPPKTNLAQPAFPPLPAFKNIKMRKKVLERYSQLPATEFNKPEAPPTP